MKIRSDFVTNSSSSSFVVEQTVSQSTVVGIALAMAQIVHDDWADEQDRFKKIFKRISDHLDSNIGLKLPSCNYDTYIWKGKDGRIYIETANNHSWGASDYLEARLDWHNDGETSREWYEAGIITPFYDVDNGRYVLGGPLYGLAQFMDGTSDTFVKVELDVRSGELLAHRYGKGTKHMLAFFPNINGEDDEWNRDNALLKEVNRIRNKFGLSEIVKNPDRGD